MILLSNFLSIQSAFLILSSAQSFANENPPELSCFPNSGNDEFCQKFNKRKRYFLYDVNPGEGFNLRRDIYIRIAPLIANLNEIDYESQWILVLPPWGNIPHWTNQEDYFPWSTFFQVEEIRKYIPALELSEYLNEYGYDSKIDMVYQLQHFPFDPQDRTWSEKIEVGVPCEEGFMYQWNDGTGDFRGNFWNEKMSAVNATCTSLRGQASTLAKFLITSNFTSIMFDRAEVILWDEYGGVDWWKARRSLRFSENLTRIGINYLNQVFNETEELLGGYKYVGVHLRRQDFVYGRRKLTLPSVQGAAKQAFQIAKRLKLDGIFLATDGTADEFQDFYLATNILKKDYDSSIKFLSLHPDAPRILPLDLTEGQLAILDQIICTLSTYFIGTPDSTFSLRIFEEREILGVFDSDSTFNYLCPDLPEEEDVFTEVTECKQPTKWLMKS